MGSLPQNDILFGTDDTPGIVAVSSSQSGPSHGKPAGVTVYRKKNGVLFTEQHAHFPFFLLRDINTLRHVPRLPLEFHRLNGSNRFQYLVLFEDWSSYWTALREVERETGRRIRSRNDVLVFPDPVQQYLMFTGKTLFKNTDEDELVRMQWFISVLGDDESTHAEHRIDTIAIADNHGRLKILKATEHGSESTLLRAFISCINEWDPDVIEGHNIIRYILPLLLDRCTVHRIRFSIGRSGLPVRSFPTTTRFGERTISFPGFEIPGRHVIDTQLLAISYDAEHRDMFGYGLSDAARYFGLRPTGISRLGPEKYVRENKAREQTDPHVLRLEEVRGLSRILSRPCFYESRMVPMGYGRLARTGAPAKVEAMLVREYLRQREAIPRNVRGAHTGPLLPHGYEIGLARPVVSVRIDYLIPTLMLRYGIQPFSDKLGVFGTMLRDLLAYAEDKVPNSAQRAGYQTLLDGLPRILGFSQSLFNDPELSRKLAKLTLEVQNDVLRQFSSSGGIVVVHSQKGLFVQPPPDRRKPDDLQRFLQAISERIPSTLMLRLREELRAVLVLKPGTYVAIRPNGEIRFFGSIFRSTGNEPFYRKWVRDVAVLLLEGDIQGVHDLYISTRARISGRDWSVEDFVREETLRVSSDQYSFEVLNGTRHRTPAYEVALADAAHSGRSFRAGERVSYYVTGNRTGEPLYLSVRAARIWDVKHPDECTRHYLERLREATLEFQSVFSEKDFYSVFSEPDLFGFDAATVSIRTLR